VSAGNDISGPVASKRGVRSGVRTSALLLTTLALGFYVAFIAMTIYRNRHG
jgi:hypothetical protein